MECKQFYKFLQIILLYNLQKIKYTKKKGWKDMDILDSKHNWGGTNELVELTILGNYGPYATAQGACSGYLLNADGFQIMLDCGNGSFSKLQKYADYSKLGILILSHLHPDH